MGIAIIWHPTSDLWSLLLVARSWLQNLWLQLIRNLRRSFVEPPRREGCQELLMGSFRPWKKDSGSKQAKPCRAVVRYSIIAF